MSEKSPGDDSDPSPSSPDPKIKRNYRRRMSEWRVPPAAGATQVNHCRNLSCSNFGVPSVVTQLRKGRKKGHVVTEDLPTADEASCPHESCANHGKTLTQNPGA